MIVQFVQIVQKFVKSPLNPPPSLIYTIVIIFSIFQELFLLFKNLINNKVYLLLKSWSVPSSLPFDSFSKEIGNKSLPVDVRRQPSSKLSKNFSLHWNACVQWRDLSVFRCKQHD